MIERPPLIDTFELPSREELLDVNVGDWVKLLFSDDGVERMWVKVTNLGERQWVGTLDNIPLFVDYKLGDVIKFHPLDVIAVM